MADIPWQPFAGRRELAARAVLLNQIRAFFAARDVLEVETPLLCRFTVTDPSLSPIACGERWLQTSPEYAMKRLLATGCGPVYQICKAFRGGEVGTLHNPEFTLLEWYRPDFSLAQLMGEVAELVCGVLQRSDWESLGYAELFKRFVGVDPHTAELDELEACARAHIDYSGQSESRETWLDLIMSQVIEPRLKEMGLLFVTDYPASRAMLARVRESNGVEVAERFELYVDGIELANGYRELVDPLEQRRRFEQDNTALAQRGHPPRPLDEGLLAALDHGLPACSGVALGVDRLLMASAQIADIRHVLSFDWTRC